MLKWIAQTVVGASLGLALVTPASSLPLAAAPQASHGGDVVRIAEGCGPGRWRGPWGGCRDAPYVGPVPGGGYAYPRHGYGVYGNGCAPGHWRGPWGHCRNTPYHGRLPNGGWK